jgi:two-component system NtrC family response regulator
MNETILVVDDDPSVVTSLRLVLKHAGYRCVTASGPDEALSKLGATSCDLVLQDMNFSRNTTGEEGLALLAEVKRRRPATPVILMTAWGSIGLAVRGMRAGAADFVTKPWTQQQLTQSVRTAIGLAAAETGHDARPLTRDDLDARFDLRGVVGSDPELLAVLDLVCRVAPTDASVLVTGESGTGKEAIAEALHRNSARRGGPFVKVNLGGVPASLFESEMFGHVRGAFTDAHQTRKGRFELADGGTIFLDEIGDLDPSSQVKLLRVLQDRTFEVLGSSATRSVDVRVIAATNRDLATMVARGEFREDLLYRINLIAVRLPPLRERPGDVVALAAHFLTAAAAAHNRGPLALDPAASRWLREQPWPGNIRELRNCVERAVLVSAGATIGPRDLLAQAPSARADSLPAVGTMTMDEIERAMILKSLKHHEGNVSKVAESLGLSRAALYRRFEKYGIDY